MNVLDVTLVADTNAYADGDVLAIPQEIVNSVAEAGTARQLTSIVVIDSDDQGTAIDLIFFDASASLGTINTAIDISDADAAKVVGIVAIAAGDFKDLINNKVAVKTGIDLVMKAASTSASLWVGAVVRSGTPTYSAGGIKLKLGFA